MQERLSSASMVREPHSRAFAALVVAALVIGCASDSISPDLQVVKPGSGPAKVDSLTLTPVSATIVVGGVVQFSASAYGRGALLSDANINWKSDHPTIAKVDGTGAVTGVAPGAAYVEAKSGGTSIASLVTVLGGPAVTAATVTIAPASAELAVGQTLRLTATARDGTGNVLTGHAVTWSSVAPLTASVDSTGLVRGLAEGGVSITASVDGKLAAAQVTVTPVPAASVAVTPASASVVAGGSIQLAATVRDGAGNVLRRAVAWRTGDARTATVDSLGLVRAIAAGTTAITATVDGVSAAASLTVTAAPVASVAVTPASVTVGLGSTQQLAATAKDATGNALAGRTTTWSTNAPAVASVSAAGVVTGVAVGSASITASVEGKSASAAVSVAASPPATAASVILEPTSATVAVGATQQLTATALDASGHVLSGRTFTWTSSAPSIATVSATGLVTGVLAGFATITVTVDGKSASAAIAVPIPPTPPPVTVATVSVSPTSATVAIGAAQQLTATAKDAGGNVLTGRTFTWTSNAPAIASVSAGGLVTGATAGSATITVTVEGKTATAAITVPVSTTPPVTAASVTLSPTSATVAVGATQQLTATALDGSGNVLSGRTFTWTSSAASIASVSASGLVTGVAAGSATITVTVDGKTATAAIAVPAPPPVTAASVTLSPTSATVAVGATQQLTATALDGAGNVLSGRTFTWTSSAASIASVSASGLVTGVAAGAATITVTVDGKTATAAITVPAPTVTAASVTLSPTSATVSIGATQQLTATAKDASGNVLTGRTFSWTSSAATVASVNASGLVTGVAAGSATITVTVDGKTATAGITVPAPAPASVASVTVSPASATIAAGATQQLTATVKDSAGNVLTGRTVTWASGAATIASVSTGGLVTGVAVGSATVTATVGGKSGSSAITVTAPPPPGAWPNNQPSGLTQLLAADGSTKYYFAPHTNTNVGAKWSDATVYPAANNGTRVQVVSDPTSKFGKAVQKWTFTGETSGFNGEYDWQGTPGFGDANGYKELYFRIVFKFDPNWQWEYAHTQKLFYFATNRTNGGGANANSFYLSVDRSQVDFVVQANPTTGNGGQYNIDYRYSPPAGTIAAGKYITVEFWIRANSSPTTPDGQARMWVDGTEITANMTALMGAYSGQRGLSNRIWCGDTSFFGTGTGFNANFNNTQTLLFWGGSGDTAATNFYFNMSELYISGLPG